MKLLELQTPDGGPKFFLNPLEVWGVGQNFAGETLIRTVHPMMRQGGDTPETRLFVEETPEEVARMWRDAMRED